jgi:hypothetical protein
VSDVEQVKAGLPKIIADVESQHRGNGNLRCVPASRGNINSLTTGSQNPAVEEASKVIAAAAQYVFYAEGKSEEVRYAIETVVRGL